MHNETDNVIKQKEGYATKGQLPFSALQSLLAVCLITVCSLVLFFIARFRPFDIDTLSTLQAWGSNAKLIASKDFPIWDQQSWGGI